MLNIHYTVNEHDPQVFTIQVKREDRVAAYNDLLDKGHFIVGES